MDDRFGEEDTAYRPDDTSLYDSKPVKDQLMDQLKQQTKQFADFFKTALFGDDGYVKTIIFCTLFYTRIVSYINHVV